MAEIALRRALFPLIEKSFTNLFDSEDGACHKAEHAARTEKTCRPWNGWHDASAHVYGKECANWFCREKPRITLHDTKLPKNKPRDRRFFKQRDQLLSNY